MPIVASHSFIVDELNKPVPFKASIGGGDADIEIEPLQVTENGTYTAPTGKAYSPVEVAVQQWADELKGIIDGSATTLADLPQGITKIRKDFASVVNKYNYRNLPAVYKQVEYIESHGTEYIDTGIVAKYPARATANIEWTEVPSDGDLFGARDATSRLYYIHVYGGWCLGFGNFYSSNVNPAVNRKYAVDMAIQNGYQQLFVDGATVRQWTVQGTFTLTQNFYLFAMNNNGYDRSHVKARVYDLQLRNGMTLASPLLLDLVPCIEEATGKYGMFDMVSMTFKGNQGTGDFTGGAEVPDIQYGYSAADLNVTEIGAYAFYNNDLNSLTLRANQVVTLGENALNGTPIADGNGHIYVPADLVSAYQADASWSAYAGVIEAING